MQTLILALTLSRPITETQNWKKEKITKGENYKRRPGVQNFYGLKMVFDEPTFNFHPSLQKVKPPSLYVLYILKSEMKLALSPRSFPASQRNEYIPCKVLKAKTKRICDLVNVVPFTESNANLMHDCMTFDFEFRSFHDSVQTNETKNWLKRCSSCLHLCIFFTLGIYINIWHLKNKGKS